MTEKSYRLCHVVNFIYLSITTLMDNAVVTEVLTMLLYRA